MPRKQLTPKTKAFIQRRIDQPKETLAKSVLEAGYNAKDSLTASNMGSELMNKPEVIMALGQHAELFESAIVRTVNDWQDSDKPRKREIALTAAMFGHDKVFGKATTRIEQQTSIVKININLTGDGDNSPPPEMLEDD
jgi:phage terminase small subunit